MTALHHTHLPKLSEAGLISYYHEQDLITLGPNAPLAMAHLNLLTEQEL